MHVVIANERLIPRFGVDRLLLALAEGFRAAGHRVTLVCCRCDVKTAQARADRLEVLGFARGALETEDRIMSAKLAQIVRERARGEPVVVLVGGWPFFTFASEAATLNVPTVFVDAGAVPHDGMGEPEIHGQRALRRLRAKQLSRFTRVTPISRFIAESQTVPERGSSAGVQVIPLGADHVERPMFEGRAHDEPPPILKEVREGVRAGVRHVLALGRWEPGNYKNSAAALEVLDVARAQGVDARLVVLATADEMQVPGPLRPHVVAAGHPDDRALTELMRLCDVGVSLSRWEGFNLPLAEMQQLGRPALALAVGAHPEVVAAPELLCADAVGMGHKVAALLKGEMDVADALERFVGTLPWSRTVDRYLTLFEALVRPRRGRPCSLREARLVVDVTNSARDVANSGVVRVTRRLSAALQDLGQPLLFVAWDAEAWDYRLLRPEEHAVLQINGGPQDPLAQMTPPHGGYGSLDDALRLGGAAPLTFLVPEVVLDHSLGHRLRRIRRRGGKAAALLYDLIPVEFPEFCSHEVLDAFPAYVDALFEADAIYADSAFAAGQFERYATGAGRAPPPLSVEWLPGQFGDHPRGGLELPTTSRRVDILCVSTIEPRKNHRVLLAAFRKVVDRRPDLELRLHLVGNAYAGGEALAADVRAACRAGDVSWRGVVSDEELLRLYRDSAFTVYPSLVEGFGIPVLESLWMGRPCLCNDDGVMAELAAGGGCLSVDMTDVGAVADAVERLAADPALRRRLGAEALARPIRTWGDYGRDVRDRLEVLVS